MKAITIASMFSFSSAALAGPPWQFMMDADHERVATLEGNYCKYSDKVRVIVKIPKNQKGFDGKEISIANLEDSQEEKLVFGALLDLVDMKNYQRLTFQIPERYLKTTVIKSQTSPISSVTYLLQISDHLSSDGHLPGKELDKVDQMSDGQAHKLLDFKGSDKSE